MRKEVLRIKKNPDRPGFCTLLSGFFRITAFFNRKIKKYGSPLYHGLPHFVAEMERFELLRRFEPTYRISSLVRTWHFRVCCGRWRQFWKRRKPLCCNGFRTRQPVLTSSISEKTRVQIEMRNAPKRSIFCALARKYARRKPLSGMALRTAARIKCKKNRLKTDYTKHPFGPKHRKEPSL